MWKKLVLVSILLISSLKVVCGQTLCPNDTLDLTYPTMINYDLKNWDTVYAKLYHLGTVVNTVGLKSNGDGLWFNKYDCSSLKPGSYQAVYFAVYSGDTTGEVYPFSILDTLKLQGSASGLTAQSIVELMAEQGWFTGIGTYSCTVYVKLSSDNSALGGVRIIVKNADQTAPVDHGWTDVNGMAVFHLDSMATGLKYKFWLIDLDYSFSNPESADIGSDTKLTFYGSAFNYGSPPPDSQTMVVGQVFNPFLDSLSGVKVMAKVFVPEGGILHYHGYPITPFEVGDTTDATGRFRLDLIPNTLLGPAGTKYIFNFFYPLKDAKYFIKADTVSVPYSGTPVQYGDLKEW